MYTLSATAINLFITSAYDQTISILESHSEEKNNNIPLSYDPYTLFQRTAMRNTSIALAQIS